MSTETPAQRRKELIEQYAGSIYAEGKYYPKDAIVAAIELADAVIAATQQEPTSELQKHIEQHRAEIKARYHKGTGTPTTMEARLMDLCELAYTSGSMWCEWVKEFESIKKHIGARKV